jgi:RNA polymerase sigma factor (sigma-70 family)
MAGPGAPVVFRAEPWQNPAVTTSTIPAQLPQAYRQFLALVADVRPELHRYCARMTGSIVDGEDVVQDTLARTFYALGMLEEVPELRPWLFRVAHNAAIDFVRRRRRSPVDLVAELPELPDAEESVDAETVRAALAAFLTLPPLQRSVVILKDVVGHSAAEIAEALDTSVPAVKSALVRGRERLRQERARVASESPEAASPAASAALEAYVRLFNAGDWDGVRALLAEEVRLDLVSTASRRGKAVGVYFGRYAAEPDVRLALGELEGCPVLWAFVPRDSAAPRYFIALELRGDRVTAIRDYRYVRYIAGDLACAPHRIG